MNLQSIQAFKAQAAQELTDHLRPHMTAKLGTAPVWMSRDSRGYTSPLVLDDSNLSPVFGITPDGVLLNCYGNGVIRKWEHVPVEDLLRLSETVMTHLTVSFPLPSAKA